MKVIPDYKNLDSRANRLEMNLKLFVLFSFVLLIACNRVNNKHEIKPELKEKIKSFSIELNSMNKERIEKITTENGFKSILEWSDSLKDVTFVKSLANDLEKFQVFEIEQNDSMVNLSLGRQDKILGATGGYLFLKRHRDEFKIENYRGGK